MGDFSDCDHSNRRNDARLRQHAGHETGAANMPIDIRTARHWSSGLSKCSLKISWIEITHLRSMQKLLHARF